MGSHGDHHDAFQHLLASNKAWAEKTAHHSPDLFPTLSKGQHPPILWIGCSDSRVPETTLAGLDPGQIFVHRNIANVLSPTDLSAASVIEYAVAHVGVQHVVLCGHTACGGCTAALGNSKIGVIDAWLLPLRALREKGAKALEGKESKEQLQWLVEENVKAGVQTLRQNTNVIKAVKGRGLQVHGVVYEIETGLLKVLDVEESEEEKKARDWAFETS